MQAYYQNIPLKVTVLIPPLLSVVPWLPRHVAACAHRALTVHPRSDTDANVTKAALVLLCVYVIGVIKACDTFERVALFWFRAYQLTWIWIWATNTTHATPLCTSVSVGDCIAVACVAVVAMLWTCRRW